MYLPRLQGEKQAQLKDEQMSEILESHALKPNLLRSDDFEAFLTDRRARLCSCPKAMGKQISIISDGDEYLLDDEEAPT